MKRQHDRFTKYRAVIALCCGLLLPGLASAEEVQSIIEIEGAGEPQSTAYYYTLTAEAGEITATLKATTVAGAADAYLSVELLDENFKEIAAARFDRSVERAIKESLRRGLAEALPGVIEAQPAAKNATARLRVDSPRTLMMRLTIGRGVAQYLVRLSGPVTVQPGRAAIHAGVAEDQSQAAEPEELSPESDVAVAGETTVEETATAEEEPIAESEVPAVEEEVAAAATEEVEETVIDGFAEEEAAPVSAEPDTTSNTSPPKKLVIPGRKIGSVLKVPGKTVKKGPTVVRTAPPRIRVITPSLKKVSPKPAITLKPVESKPKSKPGVIQIKPKPAPSKQIVIKKKG